MSLELNRVVACQEELIEALDAGNAEAIERTSIELAEALHALSGQGAVRETDKEAIERALLKADAARIRVNILSDWTRQRIDRLSEIRSGSSPSYRKRGVFPQPA
ncbi:MAG TPA: hypothetical protein VFH89_13385 [Sphingomicrobium sp.]|nr:hypothetical protein [Sphingomicrobium sp.]